MLYWSNTHTKYSPCGLNRYVFDCRLEKSRLEREKLEAEREKIALERERQKRERERVEREREEERRRDEQMRYVCGNCTFTYSQKRLIMILKYIML